MRSKKARLKSEPPERVSFGEKKGEMPVLAQQKISAAKEKNHPAHSDWSADFLFAGTSALLLHVSNLFPAYWYLSFVALLPFLHRIVKASPVSALRLGFIFGLSFLSVAVLDDLRAAPVPALAKFFSGLALISLFGWLVGWGKEKFGFNPVFVSLLWVGFELGAVRAGFVSGFLESPKFLASPFFHGMAALFGFLAISFVIVLVNSLLVLAVQKVAALSSSRSWSAAEPVTLLQVYKPGRFVSQLVYLIPEGRAPPVPAGV